jgi:hypothetical protein
MCALLLELCLSFSLQASFGIFLSLKTTKSFVALLDRHRSQPPEDAQSCPAEESKGLS